MNAIMNDEGSFCLTKVLGKYTSNQPCLQFYVIAILADTDLQYKKILFPLASVYPSGSCTNYLLEYYLGHTVPRGAFL